MNYYYDLTLNFGINSVYKFYEWELEDNLIDIKKIPLFKIDEKTIKNLFLYNGSVLDDFLKKIKDRTTYKKDGKIKPIMYAAIFTDTKFSIALIFGKNGNIIGKSYLMLEDELNIIEIGYSIKKENLIFHKANKANNKNLFRQEEKMKKTIKKEIEKSYQDGDKSKLIYYHLEWFNHYEDNIDLIYKKIMNELNKPEVEGLNKMYTLILQVS